MVDDRPDPLVIGVLFPGDYDPAPLIAACAPFRALDVRVAEYVDDLDVRRAKTEGRHNPDRPEPQLTRQVQAILSEAEVLVAMDLPASTPVLAPHLKWVQGFGAGVGQLGGVLRGTGIPLTTSRGVSAPAIAEFVIGRLLEVWKGYRDIDDQQREHLWRHRLGRTVTGLRLAIVGYGEIGHAVAHLGLALGMSVEAIRRRTADSAERDGAVRVYGTGELLNVLSRCDALVLCAPETRETRELIGARELALLPGGAVICNVGRGSILDEDALVDALRSGHLAAAILDVTREQPLPASSPLWDAPGMYLSAHSAVSLDHYGQRLHALMVDNIDRYLRGVPLRNLFQDDRGY